MPTNQNIRDTQTIARLSTSSDQKPSGLFCVDRDAIMPTADQELEALLFDFSGFPPFTITFGLTQPKSYFTIKPFPLFWAFISLLSSYWHPVVGVPKSVAASIEYCKS